MANVYNVLFFLLLSNSVADKKPEFNLQWIQSEYSLVPERAEVVGFNERYHNILDIKTFKYNRTCTAFNCTLNFNTDPSKLDVLIQAYKFMSNEYRLFPIRMQLNYCKGLNANIAGLQVFKCGNFTGCPMVKGRTYHMCNWTPDGTKFPPLIPSGRYMLEMQFLHSSEVTASLRAYAAVKRPEV